MAVNMKKDQNDPLMPSGDMRRQILHYDLLFAKQHRIRFESAICESRFADRLYLFADHYKQFFMKFASQNFPSVFSLSFCLQGNHEVSVCTAS